MLTINYLSNAAQSPNNYVEVIAENEQIIDYTPGNGNGQVNEYDEAINGTTCNLTATIQSIDCDDQGTSTGADDTYSVTFLVENGGVSGTWTANNGGTNPSFNGSYGVPFTLQGGNIISAGGLQVVVAFSDNSNSACSTTASWTPPATTCSTSGADPCDALTEYQNALAVPPKVTWRNSPTGIISVVYSTPNGSLDSFIVDGPAALAITIAANNTFLARDVACTTNGFAITGTFRDSVNPSNAQPFIFRLDAQGNVLQASIPFLPGTSAFNDALGFSIFATVPDGANRDILYTELFSFSRSYQLAAFDGANNLLWQNQMIGDLVTNRIGGATLSDDNTMIYFSYRNGNQESWPRLRGVNPLDGSTNWEILLGDLIGSTNFIVSGNVSPPLNMPNGDVVLGFTARSNGVQDPYVIRVDMPGNVVFLTPAPALSTPTGSAPVPQFVSAAGNIVFEAFSSIEVVTGAGNFVNCTGSQGVDLELSAVSTQAQPAIYDVNNITFTLSNLGNETATGITVDVPRPTDVRYTGSNEFTASQGTLSTFGTYVWTVGDLAPGATAILVVNYFSLSATGYTQYAEVLTVDQTDTDSSPGNGNGTSAGEDDEVFLDLTNATITQALTFFPNPAPQGEQVILDFVSSGETTQTVIFSDLTGRPVHTTQVTFLEGRNQIPVDLGMLPSGVYIVAFPESGLHPKRIIIQE